MSTHSDHVESVTARQPSLARRPAEAASQVHLGESLRVAGDLAGAAAAYRDALRLDPRSTEAYNCLGTLFASLRDQTTAVTFFQAALAINPELAQVHNNLANLHMDAHQYEAAAARYKQALVLRPCDPVYLSQLGNALHLQGLETEAETTLRQAITLHPAFAPACVNLGLVLAERGACAEAETWYRRAIELQPDLALAHVSLAMMLLKRGDLRSGWIEQEWRWRWKDFPSPRRAFAALLWRGEPIPGATILLHAEQGFGDTLQFVRYVPLVVTLGARVILEVPRKLTRLASTIPGVAAVVTHGEPLPPLDWHCPLMSLPLAFATDLQTIPANVPYLRAPGMRPGWALAAGAQLRVGLASAGSPKSSIDARRSIPLPALAPLWSVPGIALFSLQPGSSGSQFAASIADGADFADTAAAIEELDLVISVDTAVAHLAGALGKPVWILLPNVAEWRWLENRDDCPWYPTARIFRQPRAGAWAELIEHVADELRRVATRQHA